MNYRPLPKSLTIRNSDIDGLGIFATESIYKDTNLGLSHILDDEIYRTPLGGFINHSETPNCEKVQRGNKNYVYTIQNIKEGDEITLCYTLYKL
jgi:hypothetical protein|tara:strand:- start:65 stop:346 length:282 start_codon:yes stop_codon:yes gene_type:complete